MLKQRLYVGLDLGVLGLLLMFASLAAFGQHFTACVILTGLAVASLRVPASRIVEFGQQVVEEDPDA